MILRFTIPIAPKAQKRDRIGSRAGHGFSYKDKGQRLEEDKLSALMYQHRPPQPLTGALELWVKVFQKIPDSWSKKKKALALAGEVRPTGRPDASNYLK